MFSIVILISSVFAGFLGALLGLGGGNNGTRLCINNLLPFVTTLVGF